MRILKFENNEAYLRAQQRTHRHKKKYVPWIQEDEVRKIADYFVYNFEQDIPFEQEDGTGATGLCHGVRCGKELELFRECLPWIKMVGTDILADGKSEVVQHDFHDTVECWIGEFDFVYTNSFDHAHDPARAVRTWLRQLKPNGLLFVEWSQYHIGVRGGDCFSAALHEYMDLFDQLGDLQDLLYCKGQRVVCVVAPNAIKRDVVWEPLRDREAIDEPTKET